MLLTKRLREFVNNPEAFNSKRAYRYILKKRLKQTLEDLEIINDLIVWGKASKHLFTENVKECFYGMREKADYWTGRDLNPRPPACKAGDLPLIYRPIFLSCLPKYKFRNVSSRKVIRVTR